MLPQVDRLGQVYAEPLGVPVSWNGGVGYSATGRMCTTIVLSATDTYNNGWRLDALGRVVVANLVAPVTFNAGLPFRQTGSPGAMCRQIDAVIAPTDPYVGGIRVGPLGGVYFTSALPPVSLNSFSLAFDQGAFA